MITIKTSFKDFLVLVELVYSEAFDEYSRDFISDEQDTYLNTLMSLDYETDDDFDPKIYVDAIIYRDILYAANKLNE